MSFVLTLLLDSPRAMLKSSIAVENCFFLNSKSKGAIFRTWAAKRFASSRAPTRQRGVLESRSAIAQPADGQTRFELRRCRRLDFQFWLLQVLATTILFWMTVGETWMQLQSCTSVTGTYWDQEYGIAWCRQQEIWYRRRYVVREPAMMELKTARRSDEHIHVCKSMQNELSYESIYYLLLIERVSK